MGAAADKIDTDAARGQDSALTGLTKIADKQASGIAGEDANMNVRDEVYKLKL